MLTTNIDDATVYSRDEAISVALTNSFPGNPELVCKVVTDESNRARVGVYDTITENICAYL